jgi:hypothetical protein
MDSTDKSNIFFKDIYRNAYYVLIGKLSVNDLIEYNGCVLPFEPFTEKEDIEEKIYDDIINHFIKSEEYEKCAKIKKIKDGIYNEKNS